MTRLLPDLPEAWETDAQTLRDYGDERGASILERVVSELREALRSAGEELLTPSEAAAESFFSKRRLRELEAEGQLTNHGKRGRPLYRRSDLPRKARAASDGFNAASEARAILGAGP